MSSALSHVIQALALAFVGAFLWFGASVPDRLFSGMIDRWERDGVIRSPSSKLWKQDRPRMFAFVVNWNRSISYAWWFVLRGAAIVLWLLATVYLVTAGFTAILEN